MVRMSPRDDGRRRAAGAPERGAALSGLGAAVAAGTGTVFRAQFEMATSA